MCPYSKKATNVRDIQEGEVVEVLRDSQTGEVYFQRFGESCLSLTTCVHHGSRVRLFNIPFLEARQCDVPTEFEAFFAEDENEEQCYVVLDDGRFVNLADLAISDPETLDGRCVKITYIRDFKGAAEYGVFESRCRDFFGQSSVMMSDVDYHIPPEPRSVGHIHHQLRSKNPAGPLLKFDRLPAVLTADGRITYPDSELSGEEPSVREFLPEEESFLVDA